MRTGISYTNHDRHCRHEMLRATRSRIILPMLPVSSWDQDGHLVSPCSLEAAVVKALATTHASVTAFTTYTNSMHDVVADNIFAVIISGMISVRLGLNKIDFPDMPGGTLDILCSICKEMMDYNKSTVKLFTDHYITHGTKGLDELRIPGDSGGSEDSDYHLYLLFMDIKSVVSSWIDTRVRDLPPKKKIKRMNLMNLKGVDQ